MQESPLQSFAKLNTNRSVLGNPDKASAGDVLHDSDRRWIKGFSRNIGITTTFAAKLWGLRDGLGLENILNIRKIMVHIDAKSVVDILNLANDQTVLIHPNSRVILQYLHFFCSHSTYSISIIIYDISTIICDVGTI